MKIRRPKTEALAKKKGERKIKRKNPEPLEGGRITPKNHYSEQTQWPSEKSFGDLILAYNSFWRIQRDTGPITKKSSVTDKQYVAWLNLEVSAHQKIIELRVRDGEKLPKKEKIENKKFRKQLKKLAA